MSGDVDVVAINDPFIDGEYMAYMVSAELQRNFPYTGCSRYPRIVADNKKQQSRRGADTLDGNPNAKQTSCLCHCCKCVAARPNRYEVLA
jgi:hypothetical protein